MCFRRRTPVYQVPMPSPSHETEADLLRRAFGLIQRRITEYLAGSYPEARWIWEVPNAQAHIAAGEPVHINLNRAGGYRRAEVQIVRLQFKGLRFESVAKPAPPQPDETPDELDDTDYSFLAYEWVEANLAELGERANGETEINILAEDLPCPESWQAICDVLMHNGFSEATVKETGIKTKLSE